MCRIAEGVNILSDLVDFALGRGDFSKVLRRTLDFCQADPKHIAARLGVLPVSTAKWLSGEHAPPREIQAATIAVLRDFVVLAINCEMVSANMKKAV